MDDNSKRTADPDGRGRDERIREIADDCLQRWTVNESFSIQSVLETHKDLLPELEYELRKVRVIADAGRVELSDTRGGESSSKPTERSPVDIRPSSRSSAGSPDEKDNSGRAMPDRFGRYEVIRMIGQGVFGTVYLANDSQLKRMVAVKGPEGQQVLRLQDVERYMSEARVVASLDHPSIVPVYDVGQTEDGISYVVSKYIEGSDLRQVIRTGSVSQEQAAELVAEIADALNVVRVRLNERACHDRVRAPSLSLGWRVFVARSTQTARRFLREFLPRVLLVCKATHAPEADVRLSVSAMANHQHVGPTVDEVWRFAWDGQCGKSCTCGKDA